MITAMSSANTAQVLFCWLRETAPGHLECDLAMPIDRADAPLAALGLHPLQQRTAATTSPVTLGQVSSALSSERSFREVPEWARRKLTSMFGAIQSDEQAAAAGRQLQVVIDACARAVAAAPAGSGVEVHLPYLSRRAWSNRFEHLAASDYKLIDGRVMPSQVAESIAEWNSYNAMLMAACTARPDAALRLRHTFACDLPAVVALPLLEAAFGAEAARSFDGSDPVVSMSLAPAALSAWRKAPLEKSPAYFPAHAAVSVALQNAFRRWFTWMWFSDPARWEDVEAGHAMLAYAASRPFPGRRRTDFTWDVLTADWLYGAFRNAGRGFTAKLRAVRQAMAAAGRMDLADQYKPAESKAILTRVRKQKKAVRDIVAAEGVIVNHLLQFGLALRTADSVFELGHEAVEFAEGLAVRLRRASKDVDLTPLATMVLLEATNALHTALGGENQLETRFGAMPPEVLESLAA